MVTKIYFAFKFFSHLCYSILSKNNIALCCSEEVADSNDRKLIYYYGIAVMSCVPSAIDVPY